MVQAYRRIRRLGQGSGGEVWLAEGPTGLVALKVARAGSNLRPEADLLGSVRHPSVAQVLGQDRAGAWIALEYAPNGRSDDWSRGQPLPVVVEFLARTAEGLAALHAAGRVHGDIKPANVLVAADGTPRIVDPSAQRRPDAVGTLGFVAPEVIRGEVPSVAADVYGLGALAYQLLARRAPFVEEDPSALSVRPLRSLPLPPSAIRPRLSRLLDDLVLQLLARRTSARPAPSATLPTLLRWALQSGPRAPMVGMLREREVLRDAVAGLLDGRPGCIVVHGKLGSGRRALIRETVRTALREGASMPAASHDRRALLAEFGGGGPWVLPLDGNAPESGPLIHRLLTAQFDVLCLVRADRPLLDASRLGARHVSPPPLELGDVALVLEAVGRDRRGAEEFLVRCGGSPAALQHLLHAQLVDPGQLDSLERRILDELRDDPLAVPDLAGRVGLSEHRLLDHVEPLMDRGLVSASGDGFTLTGTQRLATPTDASHDTFAELTPRPDIAPTRGSPARGSGESSR